MGTKIMDVIPEEQAQTLRREFNKERHFNRSRSYVKTNDVDFVEKAIEKFGKESVELALIVKNNAEIRRFTSKNIISHLIAEGKASIEDKIHVEFLWNKFKVTRNVDGNNLSTEYLYTESFFIKSLVDSFEQFSTNASETIGAFVNKYNVETK